MRIQRMILTGFLIITAGAAISEEVEKTETKHFKLSSDGEISLTGNDGYIQIKTWDRDEVLLKMTMRAWGRNRSEAQKLLDDIRVRIQDRRDRLMIREMPARDEEHFSLFDLFDGDFWREKRWRKATVDYELTVPRRAGLKLQSDEGDVEIVEAEGNISIDIDEGNVDLESIRSEDLQIFVDEGNVSIRDLWAEKAGRLKIDADEGDIHLNNCRVEEVTVATDEGEIILRDIRLTRCWLTTDEGDIMAETDLCNNCSCRLETDEGRITVRLSGDANVYIRAEAEEGRIDTDFDLEIDEIEDGERAEGVIGSRLGVLKLYTQEGDIDIFRQ